MNYVGTFISGKVSGISAIIVIYRDFRAPLPATVSASAHIAETWGMVVEAIAEDDDGPATPRLLRPPHRTARRQPSFNDVAESLSQMVESGELEGPVPQVSEVVRGARASRWRARFRLGAWRCIGSPRAQGR